MSERLTDAQLAAIEAAEQKATPGPWTWEVNLKSKGVYLCGSGKYVMDFVRWGMGGAQPRFRNSENLMVEADELSQIVPGREHHESWHRTLEHPDATFIALLRNHARALVAEVRAWRSGALGNCGNVGCRDDGIVCRHAAAAFKARGEPESGETKTK